ncbi:MULTISPECIES: ABC transporter ATP-binding protein [Lysinibacillus]|uniref:ABC transporter ATP-binding protein n=1 Tax=Lysinibacillus TaxID=400634 RepID=UPI00055B3BEC|nr:MULTISPECIES: ATP-binding cassette domain-containing protein [Lysinibacillus]KUF29643.1 multidrug ABC transporter ATP-binding protein [Lysinibacillus sp. F5]MEE3809176.1 ATP-binding cassette domain-containing protein [Lysinibacillus fusiformis]
MIEIKKVSKSIKEQTILKNITITVKDGNCIGLVGHNGSGKTMLLKAVSGFTKIDSGEIWVDGKQIVFGKEYIKNTGIILEQPPFITYLTGLENLLILANIQKKITKEDVIQTLKKVGLSEAQNKKVRNYSLGMKQRLRIAQAIMENPQILILDEPFNGLDKESVKEIQELLIEYKNKGTTILLTSHDERHIDYLCDQVYELERGELVE